MCVSGVTGADLKKRIHAIMTLAVGSDMSPVKKLALAMAGLAAIAIPVAVGTVRARAQSGDVPKFEAVSIRPCEGGGPQGKTKSGVGRNGGRSGGGPPLDSPDRIMMPCTTARNLINQAYIMFADARFNPGRAKESVEGGLPWVGSSRYTVNAKAESPQRQTMMRGPMLQGVIEDRFKLKLHRETREVPAYELTVAKGGPKLPPFKEGTCTPNDFTVFPFKPAAPGDTRCDAVARIKGPNIAVDGQGISMDVFASTFLGMLDRPVVNKTGLRGLYAIHVEYARDEVTFPDGPPTAPSDEPAGPSIFTALQEKLGLKLTPAKAMQQFLVIDHIEKPSEN
jgi:uncharacterized protein (TIGR03435 family)